MCLAALFGGAWGSHLMVATHEQERNVCSAKWMNYFEIFVLFK